MAEVAAAMLVQGADIQVVAAPVAVDIRAATQARLLQAPGQALTAHLRAPGRVLTVRGLLGATGAV